MPLIKVDKVKGLETPAELALRVGTSVTAIRHLVKTKQLDHIYLTPGMRNPKIPAGSWERYIEQHTIREQSPNNGGEDAMSVK